MNSIATAVVALTVVTFIALYWLVFRFTDPFGTGLNKARKQFPEVAETLGFEFGPPTMGYGIGELKGEYGGYRVRISADDSAEIEIELKGPVKVHLSDGEVLRSHKNEGMDAFEFKHEAANDLFKTRFAAPDLVASLASSRQLFGFVGTFNRHWGKEIARLEYGIGYVTVRFRYGNGKYIPAKDIEPMLQDLVVFAGVLESL